MKYIGCYGRIIHCKRCGAGFPIELNELAKDFPNCKSCLDIFEKEKELEVI